MVAGVAGFLGSHLAALLLAQGHRVTVLDTMQTGHQENLRELAGHARFRFIRHDVCEAYEESPALDEVYNLACPASPQPDQADPVHTMLTNVLGAHKLLRLAARHDAHFLQASPSEVHGDTEQHPQQEDDRRHVSSTGPRACLDEGKRAAESLRFDNLRLGRVNARVVRSFNTYGPPMRADDGRIVSNFVCQALAGQKLTIHGSGEQTRSLGYVSDLIRSLVALMEMPVNPAAPINLGNPNEPSIREIAELVLRLTGSRSGLELHPLPVDDPRRRCPEMGRAEALLGWRPDLALEAGRRPGAWPPRCPARRGRGPPRRPGRRRGMSTD
nr:NAD-dependent epimerase/dehydratase family protein [Falsiroseomonas tokyonensis]